nr:MAG TPA: hypothetical protein [Caudoviricetes sp.]
MNFHFKRTCEKSFFYVFLLNWISCKKFFLFLLFEYKKGLKSLLKAIKTLIN